MILSYQGIVDKGYVDDGCCIINKTKKLYCAYRHKANKKNIKFKISNEEFEDIINNRCYLCGFTNKNNGIDRVDNNEGYVLDNCTACCGQCNFMKNKYELKSYLKLLLKIHKRRNEIIAIYNLINKFEIYGKDKENLESMVEQFIKVSDFSILNKVPEDYIMKDNVTKSQNRIKISRKTLSKIKENDKKYKSELITELLNKNIYKELEKLNEIVYRRTFSLNHIISLDMSKKTEKWIKRFNNKKIEDKKIINKSNERIDEITKMLNEKLDKLDDEDIIINEEEIFDEYTDHLNKITEEHKKIKNSMLVMKSKYKKKMLNETDENKIKELQEKIDEIKYKLDNNIFTKKTAQTKEERIKSKKKFVKLSKEKMILQYGEDNTKRLLSLRTQKSKIKKMLNENSDKKLQSKLDMISKQINEIEHNKDCVIISKMNDQQLKELRYSSHLKSQQEKKNKFKRLNALRVNTSRLKKKIKTLTDDIKIKKTKDKINKNIQEIDNLMDELK